MSEINEEKEIKNEVENGNELSELEIEEEFIDEDDDLFDEGITDIYATCFKTLQDLQSYLNLDDNNFKLWLDSLHNSINITSSKDEKHSKAYYIYTSRENVIL